jgi:ABC-type Fe3+/spermidine/putrescine transport system ATPase subunit
MYAGRVVQVGRPVGVYEAPASVGVADFLGKANFLEVQVMGRSPGRLMVRLPSGAALEVRRDDPSWEPAEGEAAVLFIRPERVRVGDDGTGPAVRLQATLSRVSFLGSVVRYTLDIGTARPILADEQRALPGLKVGDPVTVRFDLDDVRPFPGDQRPWGEAS